MPVAGPAGDGISTASFAWKISGWLGCVMVNKEQIGEETNNQ